MSLIFFAALAGAVQMVAPDRWMPASIVAWQRGWKSYRIAIFSLIVFTSHVILGVALYELMKVLPLGISDDSIGFFTLLFLGIMGSIRLYRFSRIREVLYRAPDSSREIRSVMSLLGPSEMAIPVLFKAHLEGASPGPILLAFLAGTYIAGFLILMMAKESLNRPFVLPRMVQWCQSKSAAFPMAAGTVVGLILIAKRFIV